MAGHGITGFGNLPVTATKFGPGLMKNNHLYKSGN